MLRGLANAARGDVDAALNDISEAVANGVPAGYVRLFLMKASQWWTFGKLRAGPQSKRTCGVCATAADLSPAPTSGRGDCPVLDDALSQRELDVLRLLPTDPHRSRDRAAAFSSQSTLCALTQSGSSPSFDVSTGVAVTRAQELGLL